VSGACIVIGEALVDQVADRWLLGGSPANTAVQLARLGVATCLVGRVGDDERGRFLHRGLRDAGVDITYLTVDDTRPTGYTQLMFGQDGRRHFEPHRAGSAEHGFCADDVPDDVLAAAAGVHLSCNAMRSAAGRDAVMRAVEAARQGGALVTADVNLRTHLWPSVDSAVEAGRALCAQSDLVKVNAFEGALIAGSSVPEAGARSIAAMGPALAVVTLGAGGCVWAGAAGEGANPASQVVAVDSTGAGDAFSAGLIAALYRAQRPFTAADVQAAVVLATRLGGMACTAVGATTAVKEA